MLLYYNVFMYHLMETLKFSSYLLPLLSPLETFGTSTYGFKLFLKPKVTFHTYLRNKTKQSTNFKVVLSPYINNTVFLSVPHRKSCVTTNKNKII